MRDLRTRRCVRTAAVTVGALVAFGAPATAFAHSAAPAGAPAAAPVAAQAAAKKPQRTLVRTVRLADGSVGKVYRVGGHYEADILFKGRKAGTLDTRRTVLRHHGVTYSFHPYTGSLWAEKTKGGEGGKKGDKDKKDKAREQRTVVLDDGSRAVISRLPDGSYTARIHLPDGSLIGTLGKGRTVAEHNGFVYTFHPYTGQIWGEAKKEPRQDTGQENGTEGAGAQPDEGTPTPEQPGPADPVVPD